MFRGFVRSYTANTPMLRIRIFCSAALFGALWAPLSLAGPGYDGGGRTKVIESRTAADVLGVEGLAVTGVGETTASYDGVSFSGVFTARNASAVKAFSEVERAASKALDKLAKLEGAQAAVLARDAVSLSKGGGMFSGGERDAVAGFEARLTLNIKLSDLSELPAALDVVDDAGAKRVTPPEYFASDLPQRIAIARATAMTDARWAAERLAAAAGARLGRLEHVLDEVRVTGPSVFNAARSSSSEYLSSTKSADVLRASAALRVRVKAQTRWTFASDHAGGPDKGPE